MAALNATVDADKAAVENAKVQLEYATIKAPISGRTGALMVHEGNLVRANDQTALVAINQIAPISVSFAIPESRLPELKRYMAGGALSVKATPPNDEGPAAAGQASPSSTTRSTDTRHDSRQGHVPQHGSPALAWPVRQCGSHADDGSEGDRGAVGCRADRAAGHVVFVVKADQTVDMRPVTVARVSASDTVLVSGGVQAGRDRRHRRSPAAGSRAAASASRATTPSRRLKASQTTERARHEYLGTLHQASGHDDAVDARHPGVRWTRLPGSCPSPISRALISHPSASRHRCPAPAPRRWPPRSPFRWKSSSRRSPASPASTPPARRVAPTSRIQFDMNRNIDAAAQDVQSMIGRASRQLPPEMPSPPSYQKVNPAGSVDLLHRPAVVDAVARGAR